MKGVTKIIFVNLCLLILTSTQVYAHGDVQPQPVDTEGLEELGPEWRERNPYIGNEKAIEIGERAYGQNT